MRLFGHKSSAPAPTAPTSAINWTADKVKAVFELFTRTNRDTRPAQVHTGDNETFVLTPYNRLQAIAEGRKLHNNDLNVIGFLDRLGDLAVGEIGGKILFHTNDPEFNKACSKKMRSWQKDCDYRIPGFNFQEWLKLGVVTIPRDGDFAVVCDEAITDGKLLTFEADQICNVDETEWKQKAVGLGFSYTNAEGVQVPLEQHSGVLTDGNGRMVAIVGCSLRGQTSAPLAKCSILPVSIARLALRPTRFGQYRGNSRLIPMVQILQDFRQLIQAEIQSAKRSAADAIIIKQKQMGLPTNISVDQLLAGTGLTANDLPKASSANYEKLAEGRGGGVYIGSAEDDVEHCTNPRPNLAIKDFDQYTKQSCGNALGLMKSLAIGEATANQSAMRAELLLSWMTIACIQKLLERCTVDFIIPQKIMHWVESGDVPAIPDGLLAEETYSVAWPEMPILDPVAEITNIVAKLKSGTTDYDSVLGPQWRETFKRLKRNVEAAKEDGLDFLSIFETVAGAKATDSSKPKPADNQQHNQ